jgi:hypothetical protein
LSNFYKQFEKLIRNKLGITILYTSNDNKFKPFNLYVEPSISDNTVDHRSHVKLVNRDLGIEVYLENNDNENSINQKIQDDLELSYKKIVSDYDDSKQIFRTLKRIKGNLEKLRNI